MTLILTLFLAFFFPKNTFAADEFNTNQITKYQIDAMGNAMGSQQIEITNNFSQIYAKEYEISLSSEDIINIIGTDRGGNIIKNIARS